MTRSLALVFCAAFLLSSHAASAKPKVALTQIEGDASGDVRDAVVEALEGGKEVSLISGKAVNRAVDKLGDLADLTEKDFKKLASELEADAIVLGKLDKVGSSRTLKFRLFVHKKLAKGFTVSFKDAKSEKFRSVLHDKLIDKIGAAAGGDGEEEKPAKKKSSDEEEDPLAAKKDKKDKKDKKAKAAKVEDEEETKPKKAAKVEDEEETKPKKAKAAKVEDEEGARPKKTAVEEDAKPAGSSDEEEAKPAKRGDSEEEETPRKSKKKVATSEEGEEVEGGVSARVEAPHSANRVAVRLDVGVSVLQRTFKFNSKVFDNRPKNTALSPVPGVRFEAEIYPLAFSNPSSAAAGLGAGVEYDKTLKLNLSSSNEAGIAVPVTQSHYSLGVRYRLAFGKTATSPTLTLGAGYGKRKFVSDRSKLVMDASKAGILRDTPDTNYTVIDPGLMFRLPVTKMVAISLGGRGMLVTNAGPIQNLTSYGRAKVYGFEGLASVDVILGNRFALRFAGEFVQLGFQFTGVGALANNLDGDPASQDVGGLADRAIGGSATLAVLY